MVYREKESAEMKGADIIMNIHLLNKLPTPQKMGPQRMNAGICEA